MLWQSEQVMGPHWVMRKDDASHELIDMRQVMHQQNQLVNMVKTATARPALSYLIWFEIKQEM
jgi:hypothetical protein